MPKGPSNSAKRLDEDFVKTLANHHERVISNEDSYVYNYERRGDKELRNEVVTIFVRTRNPEAFKKHFNESDDTSGIDEINKDLLRISEDFELRGRRFSNAESSAVDFADHIDLNEVTHGSFFYDHFLIQQIGYRSNQKVQIVQTFDDDFLYTFGEEPVQAQFDGTLLNTEEHNWRDNWLYSYDQLLNAHDSIKYNVDVFITFEDIIWQGRILNTSINQQSRKPRGVNFNFTFYIQEKYYTNENLPPHDTHSQPVDPQKGERRLKNRISDFIDAEVSGNQLDDMEEAARNDRISPIDINRAIDDEEDDRAEIIKVVQNVIGSDDSVWSDRDLPGQNVNNTIDNLIDEIKTALEDEKATEGEIVKRMKTPLRNYQEDVRKAFSDALENNVKVHFKEIREAIISFFEMIHKIIVEDSFSFLNEKEAITVTKVDLVQPNNLPPLFEMGDPSGAVENSMHVISPFMKQNASDYSAFTSAMLVRGIPNYNVLLDSILDDLNEDYQIITGGYGWDLNRTFRESIAQRYYEPGTGMVAGLRSLLILAEDSYYDDLATNFSDIDIILDSNGNSLDNIETEAEESKYLTKLVNPWIEDLDKAIGNYADEIIQILENSKQQIDYTLASNTSIESIFAAQHNSWINEELANNSDDIEGQDLWPQSTIDTYGFGNSQLLAGYGFTKSKLHEKDILDDISEIFSEQVNISTENFQTESSPTEKLDSYFNFYRNKIFNAYPTKIVIDTSSVADVEGKIVNDDTPVESSGIEIYNTTLQLQHPSFEKNIKIDVEFAKHEIKEENDDVPDGPGDVLLASRNIVSTEYPEEESTKASGQLNISSIPEFIKGSDNNLLSVNDNGENKDLKNMRKLIQLLSHEKLQGVNGRNFQLSTDNKALALEDVAEDEKKIANYFITKLGSKSAAEQPIRGNFGDSDTGGLA